jgi:hypothetical protein
MSKASGNVGNLGNVFPTYAHARAYTIIKKSKHVPHVRHVPKTVLVQTLTTGNMAGNVITHVPHVPR